MILLYGSMGMISTLAAEEKLRIVRAKKEQEYWNFHAEELERLKRRVEERRRKTPSELLVQNLERKTSEIISNPPNEEEERFSMLEYDAGTPLEKKDLETNERFAMLEFD